MHQLKDATALNDSILVLGGSLVIASLTDTALEGYSLQKTMPLTRSIIPSSKQKKAYIWLKKEAEALLAKSSVKSILGAESIFKQGSKLKDDDTVLLGCFEGIDSTYITAYHFKKGVLGAIEDFMVASTESGKFEADAHVLVERLRMQNTSSLFYWAGPVACPKSQVIKELALTTWMLGSFQKLGLSASPALGFVLPGLIVLASLVTYGASVYLPYLRYMDAKATLEAESSELQGSLAFASDRLKLLKSIEGYFNGKISGLNPLMKIKSLLEVIAEEDSIRVTAFKIIWPGASSSDPAYGAFKYGSNFEVVLDVQADSSKPLVDQMKPMLVNWSAKSGFNLNYVQSTAGSIGSTDSKSSMITYSVVVQGVLK